MGCTYVHKRWDMLLEWGRLEFDVCIAGRLILRTLEATFGGRYPHGGSDYDGTNFIMDGLLFRSCGYFGCKHKNAKETTDLESVLLTK